MAKASTKAATNGTANRLEEAMSELDRKAGKGLERHLTIKAPNFQTVAIQIRGTAPFVQNKFSNKARQQIRDAQAAGSTAKKGKKRDPKDFEASYQGAMYRGRKGEYGIPASSFRKAMISACRTVGFQMTLAKLSVFVEADTYDPSDGTGLVVIKGEPVYSELPVRNDSGVVDIRARPMWHEWSATVRVRFDGDQFTAEDVVNLMMRVGMQVGVGEGRPDSKNSAGMGWGLFEVVQG